MNKVIYQCPMHPEVASDKPGNCPKCGMALTRVKSEAGGHEHAGHKMEPISQMSFWEKFRMSMTMSMGMEHTGLAGRKMAKLMEEDVEMSLSSIIVATNAVLLNRAEKDLLAV